MKPYYEQGGISIYCGDSRELDQEWDVIATDPPYGTGSMPYDIYKDTMPNWQELLTWLLSLPHPTVFTMAHTRLPDLPKWPQWLGCWDKVFTGGIVHVGASPSWEPVCFYNLPPGDKAGMTRWDDIFRFPPHGFPFKGPKLDHPCPKPVALYRRLLQILPSGVVFDPFMGTGATLRAALDTGRQAIGCDVSEAYCELAANRLMQGVLLTG